MLPFWASIYLLVWRKRRYPSWILVPGGYDGVVSGEEESTALQAPVHVVVLGRVPVRLGLPARLVAVGLQEGVLVAVQVVHQVPVAAVLRDDVDGPWGETAA